MTINEDIKERLREYKVPMDDGLTYLLSVYYGLKPSIFPDGLRTKINICRVYERDESTHTLKWNIPLFDEQVTGFEWVGEWMDRFGDINKDRKGVKKYVMARMKKFFVDNPDVRKEEVIGGTEMYFMNVSSPQYLKSSHKFIMDGRGADKYSLLEEWVEKYRNWQGAGTGRSSYTNTMKT